MNCTYIQTMNAVAQSVMQLSKHTVNLYETRTDLYSESDHISCRAKVYGDHGQKSIKSAPLTHIAAFF